MIFKMSSPRLCIVVGTEVGHTESLPAEVLARRVLRAIQASGPCGPLVTSREECKRIGIQAHCGNPVPWIP